VSIVRSDPFLMTPFSQCRWQNVGNAKFSFYAQTLDAQQRESVLRDRHTSGFTEKELAMLATVLTEN